MEEGSKNAKTISVEAKNFTFFQSTGGFVFKEVHRKGKRELLLTENQVKWVKEGLLLRSQRFGETRRKELKEVDGETIVMTEGSNKTGCFISIHFKGNQEDSKFLIIPSGYKGAQWRRVAKLIGSGHDLGKQPDLNQNLPGSKYVSSSRFRKTYADAVISDSQEEDVLRSWKDTIDVSVSYMVISKVENLEMEVKLLRSHVAALRSGGFNTRNSLDSVMGISEIPVAATEVAESPNLLRRRMTEAENSLRKKMKVTPLDGGESHPTVRIRSEKERFFGDSKLVLCERFLSELVSIMSAADVDTQNEESDGFLSKKSSTEENTSTLVYNSDLEGHSISGQNVKGKNDSEKFHLLSKDECPLVDDDDLPSNNKEEKSFKFPRDSPMENHTDVSEKEIESDDSDDDYSSLNENEVYWDAINGNYVHLSGMRFDPQRNRYFANFSEELDDLRCLYFIPRKSKLKLAHKGELGDINKHVLSENDWEWSEVANIFGFPPNLLDLFRTKLVESEISGM